MPEVICTTVYQFPELSDAAKEKARSWYRDLGPHDDWWDAVYEDFERVCELLGIRLIQDPTNLGNKWRLTNRLPDRLARFDDACVGSCFEANFVH